MVMMVWINNDACDDGAMGYDNNSNYPSIYVSSIMYCICSLTGFSNAIALDLKRRLVVS